MNKILAFIIFFGIFLTIFLGAHIYVFLRLSNLLNIKRTIWLYLIIALLALSFPLAAILERVVHNLFARIFYMAASIWIGTIFFLLVITLLHHAISLFTKTNTRTAGIVILILTAILVIYSTINALFIGIDRVEVPIKNLDSEIKIVHISDAHIGPINRAGYLSKVVGKTNSLNPDIVLITGDLADGMNSFTEDAVQPLNDIKAPVYFTTGNHEQYAGIEKVENILKTTKIKILSNELITEKGIQIIGIDSSMEMSGDHLKETLKTILINKTKPSILMYHLPSEFEAASEAGINLQLSGHLHRGQIFPFTIFSRMFFKRIYGLYQYNNSYMYVSSGSGTWGPPMRLGSRSQITLITLKKN